MSLHEPIVGTGVMKGTVDLDIVLVAVAEAFEAELMDASIADIDDAKTENTEDLDTEAADALDAEARAAVYDDH